MELVTGHSGTPHVSAADVATMHRGTYGASDCVLDVDEQLSCKVLSANQVQIGTGGCMLQGHFCRTDVAEMLVVESGTPNYKRNDLVVARYSLDADSVQSVSLVVVKGTPTTGTAADPAITEGDIDGGASRADFVLWRIPISGVNVGTPVRIMPVEGGVRDTLAGLNASIADVESATATANHATGDYFMLGGTLMRATAAIATGEAITTANATPATVQAQIDALRDSLSSIAVEYTQDSWSVAPTATTGWNRIVTKSGYWPVGVMVYHSNSSSWMMGVESITPSLGQVTLQGFMASSSGASRAINVLVAWLRIG